VSAGIALITSGAYVDQELAAEFGQMPPAFLPVGTRRLYEYQMERNPLGRPVYLTIPDTYQPPAEDVRRLRQLGAILLAVPDGLSLGESIVFALNLIGDGDQPLWVLHGDTLIDSMPPLALDSIGIATSTEGYSWAEVDVEGDRVVALETIAANKSDGRHRPIACGWFAFSSSTALIRVITRARGSFVQGLRDYNKAISMHAVTTDAWYDFGHVQTFFRSRRLVASARHFNALHIDGRTARKSSTDAGKIRAEAHWLATVPPRLRIYTARLIDAGEDADGRAFYETEYGYLPTLSELAVFGALGPSSWLNILRSCEEFLSTCASAVTSEPAAALLQSLVVEKTSARLREFADQTRCDVDARLCYDGKAMPSLMRLADDLGRHIDFGPGRRQHVMHGDFCFSNILYDSRMQRIRVIDPRGYVENGQPSILGDLRYDMAKLTHSIFGRYDQIIAGRYQLTLTDQGGYLIEFEKTAHYDWLEAEMRRFSVDGVRADSSEVLALTIGLFLSMLPLHSDRPDRQQAFIATALRLYDQLEQRAA
jgi:hypothetical protein